MPLADADDWQGNQFGKVTFVYAVDLETDFCWRYINGKQRHHVTLI